MSESVILEEDIDENYEPTEQEVEEYAHFLQMDLPEDNDLLWIAKEGLKAPLPEPWKPCKTREDEIYYFNFETGESTWEHPCDDYYRKQYLTHKAQKSNKQGSVKKKRLPEPTLAFEFGESAPGKKTASPNLPGLKGFDDKEKDPLLRMEQEKKLKREKQEMEEKYNAEVAVVNKEYEDKRVAVRRNFERDLEMLRKQDAIRREDMEGEIRRWREAESEKARSAARRDLEAEETAEKGKLQTELQRELQKVGEEFAERLRREQQRLRTQQTEERESLLQSEESVKASEVRRLTLDMEQLQARLDATKLAAANRDRKNKAEIAAAETQAEREIAEAIARTRTDSEQRLAAERKSAEERFQREVEKVKSQSGEDSQKSVAAMQQLEANIRLEFAAKAKKLETDAESEYLGEKERAQQEHLARLREMMETESARGKSALSQELDAYRMKVQHETAQEKLQRDTEANASRLEYQKRLSQDLESEQNRVQDELRVRVRTDARSDKEARAQAIRLKQAIEDLKSEVEAMEKQGERLTEAVESLKRVPSNTEGLERAMQREESQADALQMARLEKEMETIKQLVLRKEPISPIQSPDARRSNLPDWRSTIQREKQEIKALQRALELDRERWKLEVREYELRPGSRSRSELQTVKKALDSKTKQLNERIHELRTTEKWLQRQELGKEDKTFDFELEDEVSERRLTENEAKDSIFELSDDLGSGDRGKGVAQPLGYYQATDATLLGKLQSYDRQLGLYAGRRDQARMQAAKLDNWIGATKDELRTYGTPGRDFLP